MGLWRFDEAINTGFMPGIYMKSSLSAHIV